VLAGVATVAMASCGGSKAGAGAASRSADGLMKDPPAATKDVALLKWNLSSGEPATLDAARVFGGSDILIDANLCEPLLYLSPTGDVMPALATKVDRPDDTTYVVHLRPGVAFFDGRPMTADDVVFSLDRVRDPKFGSYWGYFAERVKSVEATDRQTVTITLSKPDAIFYRMLATPMAQVLEKRYVEQAGREYGSPTGGVMCTGPYKLTRWSKGNSIVLGRNDAWWNRKARPQHPAEVRFTFVTDDATATSALTNGDFDGAYFPPKRVIARRGSGSAGTIYAGPSTMQLVLIPSRLQDKSSSLSDPRLREALAKSIDYDGIIKTFLGGAAEPLRAIMPPGSWGTAKAIYKPAYDRLPALTQDLAGAKKLVATSGVANPAMVIAVPADVPEYRAIGETLQSNAQQVGFKVTLRPLPGADFSALYSDPKARAKVDVFLSDYFADLPDPLELYMQIGVPNGASNFGRYDNPEVTRLLEEARGIADEARARAAAAEVVTAARAEAERLLDAARAEKLAVVMSGRSRRQSAGERAATPPPPASASGRPSRGAS
jgi:peptide/nickel transport system substrate-binding protein